MNILNTKCIVYNSKSKLWVKFIISCMCNTFSKTAVWWVNGVHKLQKKNHKCFDRRRQRKGRYLHSEESDTGEEVHCGLEVLQPLRTAGREVVLQSHERKTQKTVRHNTWHHIHLCPLCVCVARSIIGNTYYCVGEQCFLNVSVHVSEELSV